MLLQLSGTPPIQYAVLRTWAARRAIATAIASSKYQTVEVMVVLHYLGIGSNCTTDEAREQLHLISGTPEAITLNWSVGGAVMKHMWRFAAAALQRARIICVR